MTCKDCIHSGLCYKENDYENFPDRCGNFIPERQQGDLISREALKKVIAEWKYHGFYDKLIEVIDNAPTVELQMGRMVNGVIIPIEKSQSKWIPVDERLPEALQSVLVTSTSGRVYTSYIVHGDWEYGGNVIAWQPLPEPYKTGGAE